MNTGQIKEEDLERETNEASTNLWKNENDVKLEENEHDQQQGTTESFGAEIDEELASAAGDDHPLATVDISPVLRRHGKQKGGRWERQKWLQNRVPYTYTELIAMAINSQPDQRATLAEIYEYLRVNFDCFRGPYTGWKNCIRHTLTLAKSFHKVPRAERAGRVGLGNYWTLSEYFHRRNLSGGLGRRTRRMEIREPIHASEAIGTSATHSMGKSDAANAHQNDAPTNCWEQQQSNDVEDFLRRIGLAPRVATNNIFDMEQQNGEEDETNAKDERHTHRLREQQLTTMAPPELETPIGGHCKGTRGSDVGVGNKCDDDAIQLDLLLTKMDTLRDDKWQPLSSSLSSIMPLSSASSAFIDNAIAQSLQQFSPRQRQSDRLLSPPFSPTLSNKFGLSERRRKEMDEADEEEVITVDEDNDTVVGIEERQQHYQQQQRKDFGRVQRQPQQVPLRQKAQHSAVADSPSVAAVAQMCAWLGLVAGEMRLHLKSDGQNGSMILSSNCPGRAIHRMQFVPGNDKELLIRQFTGDQLFQEKRWTWHAHQEEQILHAIRGICFHFFFCR